MKREIKFRQPIFVKGEFRCWHYWGFISDGHFASPETNSSTIASAQEKSQQFTGLQDKNGREIYDGDVLTDEGDDIEGIVYWDETMWNVEWRSIGVDEPLFPDTIYLVVGNIHENPEILEAP